MNASDKHQIFDQFISPMVRCYQCLKNKYEELSSEIASTLNSEFELNFRDSMPDLDFMGWVWTEAKIIPKRSSEMK